MNLDKIIEQAVLNVYLRKLQAGDLDADTWRANVLALWQAVNAAMPRPFKAMATDDELYSLVKTLRESAMVFAAFKNHHNINDMVAALTDDGGKLRSFSAFRDAAMAVQEAYNMTWLEAEYNTAVASGQMAVKWQDFQGNREALPYLRFETVGDDRVRYAHQLLHGVTRHIDDAFWDTWMPPVGWNCRCDVLQVADGETEVPETLPDDKQAPPAFRFNPGKEKRLFGDKHPYFEGFSKREREDIVGKMEDLTPPEE